jgi:methylated-DNA-[protein]-cysteine S-methyltransferase
MSMQTFFLERLDTPTGPMLIVTDEEDRVRAADWSDHEQRMQSLLQRHYGDRSIRLTKAPHPSAASAALKAYFEGGLDGIDDLATATNGTDFQRRVWDELRRIPRGSTISYGTLAVRIGNAKAVRAVGLANGANPIAIIVPCHRVIGADNSLTGYGGGLERKRWLLMHEGVGQPSFDMAVA